MDFRTRCNVSLGAGGLDARDPRSLEPRRLSENWRRHPLAPTSKMDAGLYPFMGSAQVAMLFLGYRGSPGSTTYVADVYAYLWLLMGTL